MLAHVNGWEVNDIHRPRDTDDERGQKEDEGERARLNLKRNDGLVSPERLRHVRLDICLEQITRRVLPHVTWAR